MTMRVAPAASGVNTLLVRLATPTAKTRKNAPMNSTAYFRTAAAHSGAAGCTATSSVVITSAI